eukprot:CAMPEP_0172724094 /NCGR_PEP_ID=MMETSP1074-20121228/85150_1 /TAXON_ID=2916 /ORGANISM="Ceratium fusus, Strain PA161109" /LENGTH=232 /DNA_ID=CAMNT_0013550457 /DNA_START=42 /DNA_END=737 /DNA_ORIENTATION=+
MRTRQIRTAVLFCGVACWQSTWAPNFSLWPLIDAAISASGTFGGRVALPPAVNRVVTHLWTDMCGVTLVSHASETLDGVMDRAVSKHCQGNFAEAEALYEEALELASHIASEERADVLAMECQLATVLAKQHKYRAAEPVLKQALVKQQRVCNNHPLYLSTKVRLASVYHGQGKLYQAKMTYSGALSGLTALHGSGHPSCTAIKEKIELLGAQLQTKDMGLKRAVKSTMGQW